MLPIECHQVARIRHQEHIRAAQTPRPEWPVPSAERVSSGGIRLRLGAWLIERLAPAMLPDAAPRRRLSRRGEARVA
jgi:hypothetical protein